MSFTPSFFWCMLQRTALTFHSSPCTSTSLIRSLAFCFCYCTSCQSVFTHCFCFFLVAVPLACILAVWSLVYCSLVFYTLACVHAWTSLNCIVYPVPLSYIVIQLSPRFILQYIFLVLLSVCDWHVWKLQGLFKPLSKFSYFCGIMY